MIDLSEEYGMLVTDLIERTFMCMVARRFAYNIWS